MASSLFVNTIHVCFESVLAMDNAVMVAMFESLVSTGLKGFLGCPVVIHEAELLEFFENGSVRDGLVVSTVNGVTVEISEQLFAETFDLPVDGLTDLSEIPKDLVFDARSIVSLSGEPVSISGKKKEMTIEFRLLCDILAKTIFVTAGSFDAITQEKFLMMAAITCGISINWNRLLFNILKDMVTPGPASAEAEPIVKKKRTTKSKSVSSKDTLDIFPVAQDAVPLQMIKPTAAAPTDQPSSTPKRKIQKRKRRLVLGSDDEFVDQQVAKVTGETVFEQGQAAESIEERENEPAVADVANASMSTADDVDTIIEQVLAETAQIGPDEEEQDVGGLDVGEQVAPKADELEQWLNLSYEEFHAQRADQPVSTASDTGEDMETVEEMETEAVEQSADEAMSLEDILMTIPVEFPLPSTNVGITPITLGTTISILGVHEGYWYKAGLPKIPATDKGRAPLHERDPVKGNPIKEQAFRSSYVSGRRLEIFEPVSDSVSRQPTVTVWGWSQLCTAFVQYSLFAGLSTDDIRSFVSSIALDRTVLRDVQIVQSSVFVSPQVQSIASPVVEVDVRKEVKEINAKVTYLDGQVAEIRKAVMPKRGKVVATAPNHLLTIKADPAGEVVAVEIEQMNREVVLGKVVAEVEVREEVIGVDLPREDLLAVVWTVQKII
ncbi:hypothetical protein F511_39539 [Dorcoceras hygrometricum]|uniref:Dystroglycan-like n=1 Tax=Dorcoceras hygrometricum TaxID=472368 RepID=A0A2Z7BWV1_9LAMI|nr:hypothetical protein F511_39539 [Dorcoceras hygrometricum]